MPWSQEAHFKTVFVLCKDTCFKFIYFEREREKERMNGGRGEKKGDRGSKAGSVLTAESSTWDLNS